MGARGPAPKKKKTGVQIKTGAPPPPDWLDDDAAEEYQRVVDLLTEAKADIRQVDMAYLATYAQAYSDVKRKTEELRTEGDYLQTAQGHIVGNPKTQALSYAYKRLTQAASRLGFSSLDRLRLPETAPTDPGSGVNKYRMK